MNTIKYIGFYDSPTKSNERVHSLAGVNKMNYISDVLVKAGFKINIVSPSWGEYEITKNENLKPKQIILDNNKKITFFPTLKITNQFFKYIKIIYSLTYLLLWLIRHVRKNEKILVYNSPTLPFPLLIAKAIKRFSIILEVEEIHSEVWKSNFFFKRWEWKLINASDYYICASDLLATKLGVDKCLVVYGSYNLPQKNKCHLKKTEINIVYAGAIETTRGGAYKSIECLKHLDQNYTLHICGYGNNRQIDIISEFIKKTNQTLGREACLYHGKLLGKQFSNLLYSCDIALNPQNEGDYMSSAFPSKILTYLSHNLHILSTNIESIKASKLASYINFSKDDSSLEIAKTIQKINVDVRNDNYKLLHNLEENLIEDFKLLFTEKYSSKI